MNIVFDRELIEKCQANVPRYTSYPTADRFNLSYSLPIHLQQVTDWFKLEYIDQQLISLYIHIPFCNTLCLYCGCNKIITNDRSNIAVYLSYLEKEIELYAKLIDKKLPVVQLHFGGGSPSWMSITEVNQIMQVINKYFDLSTAQEIAMEIDPRHTNPEFILGLKDNGFNRISLGLQDFEYKVQKAVNRVQSFESSQAILITAKQAGFGSTNVDLIYGLPLQTLDSFTQTIETVLKLAPDRIALFNYAHIPSIFMPQTRIKESDLPSPQVKLDILQMSVAKLSKFGYKFIGMDHFALPDDELSIALNNGTLQRNFQGYSTFADTNMLSFGVSSIGFTGSGYYQNVKDLPSYYSHLDKGLLPVMRGVILNEDDLIRKCIISQIMCQYYLNYADIEQKFNLNFSDYFTVELSKLDGLCALGLIFFTPFGFEVSNSGRFLIRNIAAVFDKYLQLNQDNKRYSKVI
ncbi:MAG: oxygen-independent coproporphyrinogen III oxidase [Burkholderiales bacterium]|nr:oxygen-independent coproporphyrinogen III oxidase [Burkholderiales bacterium]